MSDQESKKKAPRRVVVNVDQSALLTTIDALGAHHVRQLEALAGRELELLGTVEDLRAAVDLKQARIAELETGRELARVELERTEASLRAAHEAKSEGDRQLSHAYTAEARLLEVIKGAHEKIGELHRALHDARQQADVKRGPDPEWIDMHLEALKDQLEVLAGALS